MASTSVIGNQQQRSNIRRESLTTATASRNDEGGVSDRQQQQQRDNSIATQQAQDRAISILTNHQLLMRYAIANNLVSKRISDTPDIAMMLESA